MLTNSSTQEGNLDHFLKQQAVRNADKEARHILSFSGGKDSTAMAVFLKDKVPDLEYVFCDTGAELVETYEYIDRIEDLLNIKVKRLNSGVSFEKWLEIHNDYLPSPRQRWCTGTMKLKPYEKYIGDDRCYSYVGIRADEEREGMISHKSTLTTIMPYKEAGIVLKDVNNMLETSGLGLPKYYDWRSRSGCYFCFFQQKIEWIGLLENHPDLFKKAAAFERKDPHYGTLFTWVQGMTLGDIASRKDEIIAELKKRKDYTTVRNAHKRTLFQQMNDLQADEQEERACIVCDL